MRTITHKEHEKDYFNGFEAMQEKINGMSFEACRDEFNRNYPVPFKHSNLAAYYYAKGELDALMSA